MSVPRLRFPGFVGVWEEKAFGAIATIGNGQVDPKIEPFASMPHISPDRIESGTGNLEGVKAAKEDGIISGKYAFDKNAIVYSKIRPNLNKLAKPGYDGICSADMYPIWAVDGVISIDFLFHIMLDERFVSDATSVSMRTGMPKINRPDLCSLKISIPQTLPEQKKIAAFLGVVDAKIAALRARVLGLQTYKRGLMQALFSQSLRFTKPDGSTFPDWEEKRLGEVFDWIKTNNLSREFLNYEGGEVQNIHYGDIHTKFKANFTQDAEQVPFISEGALLKDITDEEFCRLGDVVIADASEDYADVGKAIEIVQVRGRSLVAGLHTYIARPKGKMVALGFAGYLFRTAVMRKQIMRIAQGISVLGISKPNLSKLKLHLPHPDEQAKIAEALQAIDAKIAAVQLQVARMQDFKKGLLQQMFV